jgi:putative ABC transport system permease protein
LIDTVSWDYFKTLGIPVLRGRSFTVGDRAGRQAVAIVDERFERMHAQGRNPLGLRLRVPMFASHGETATVVGVVGDVRYDLTETSDPTVYFSYDQSPGPFLYALVRGTPPATVLASELATGSTFGARGKPVETQTYDDIIAHDTAAEHVTVEIFASFAAIALILALAGIYGLIAFSVQLRTREFGIRIALGASGASVLANVLHRVLAIAAAGIGTGIVLSAFAGRALAPYLYKITAFDAPTLICAITAMVAVALAAGLIPALRATRVNPAESLRYE